MSMLRSFSGFIGPASAGVHGAEFPQNLDPCCLSIHLKVFQHAGSNSIAFNEQAKENMLGPNVSVIQGASLLGGQSQDSLDPRRVRNKTNYFLVRAGANLLLNFRPDALQIESHLPK